MFHISLSFLDWGSVVVFVLFGLCFFLLLLDLLCLMNNRKSSCICRFCGFTRSFADCTHRLNAMSSDFAAASQQLWIPLVPRLCIARAQFEQWFIIMWSAWDESNLDSFSFATWYSGQGVMKIPRIEEVPQKHFRPKLAMKVVHPAHTQNIDISTFRLVQVESEHPLSSFPEHAQGTRFSAIVCFLLGWCGVLTNLRFCTMLLQACSLLEKENRGTSSLLRLVDHLGVITIYWTRPLESRSFLFHHFH